MSVSDYLPIALRAHTEGPVPRRRRQERGEWPGRHVLVFDTETATDAGQALLFGSCRYYRVEPAGLSLHREWLFHADDLPHRDPEGYTTLRRYAADRGLTLLSRREFVAKIFYRAAFKLRATVVGFNLPFDLSRLAVTVGEARGRFAGGFSLTLWDWEDEEGVRRENRFRPRLAVKSIDSKRAFIAFRRPDRVDEVDQIPEGSVDGKPDPSYSPPGHFLDLRTLAFALTNKPHSLASACEAFNVKRGKAEAERHGLITPEYIDYNRRDVEATAGLYEKLIEEFERHPIELAPTRAMSPAAIGKAYLDGMGIRRPLERQPDFPKDVLGFAMGAYFGGRAECHIRRVPVPVVHVDFLSMYPTVNALMGTWRFLTAERIDVIDATENVRRLLASIPLDECFNADLWRRLPTLVRIEPCGEILPVRADYAADGGWQIGCNPLTSPWNLCFSLADVIAATLLTARPPRIVRAVSLVPMGRQEGLRPIKLRGEVGIDPYQEDFFRTAVEERQRLSSRPDFLADERRRLRDSLKVTANSTGYGIFAEINRHELGARREPVAVYGVDGEPFTQLVSAVEEPGAFSFPPLAACITGAARLMLALLERLVTDAGGTFAFCDTDSMAIVASERGGPIACLGGPARTTDGRKAVLALKWEEVDRIIECFASLNPYDRTLISGSILEVEEWNFDTESGHRRELHCLAISAKRYALFNLDDDGRPILRKVSEHGLGHFLNPTDPESDDRQWISQAWERIISEALGSPAPEPRWFDRPAMSRTAASSASLLRPFADYNAARRSAEQVKPFGFLISPLVAPFGQPAGYPPERFHLFAPYEPDPRRWLDSKYLDRYSGESFPISTEGPPSPERVRVKTYGEVLAAFRVHPEPKSLDASKRPCGLASTGLLHRRPVTAATLTYIGKESNRLEERQGGVVHDFSEVLSAYADPTIDRWSTLVLPVLRDLPSRLIAEKAGLHFRTVQRQLTGETRPRARHRDALIRVAADFAAERLTSWAIEPPRDLLARLPAYLAKRGERTPVHACRECGALLTRRRARYCSEACKKRAYRRRRAGYAKPPFGPPAR